MKSSPSEMFLMESSMQPISSIVWKGRVAQDDAAWGAQTQVIPSGRTPSRSNRRLVRRSSPMRLSTTWKAYTQFRARPCLRHVSRSLTCAWSLFHIKTHLHRRLGMEAFLSVFSEGISNRKHRETSRWTVSYRFNQRGIDRILELKAYFVALWRSLKTGMISRIWTFKTVFSRD